MMKKNILQFSYPELAIELQNLHEKTFRAKQIWGFVYNKGVFDFQQMTSLSIELRHKLAQHFVVLLPKIVKQYTSLDGTEKYLIQFADQKEVETVLIPNDNRSTLCISSQVGCNMACSFCHTGTQQLVRNLTTAEIVGQVMAVKTALNDFNQDSSKRQLSNIVYMGMGEPLQNYKHVIQSIHILNHQEGLAISKRKITISTCGIIPNIYKLAQDAPVNLSISLHGTNDTLRSEIMPINKNYPIKELIQCAKDYYNNSSAKLVTFVYIMIKDINDSKEDLVALINILRQVPSKINLIPFHPWKGCDYQTSTPQTMRYFADQLHHAGFTSTIRTTRGDDIYAACGQLKSESEREKKLHNYHNTTPTK